MEIRNLVNAVFGRKPMPKQADGAPLFQSLTAYTPQFRGWDGDLYRNELVRSAVDARARHISKMQVTFQGSAKPKLRTITKVAPNEFMTWSQFLYRVSTILDMCGNACIVPVVGDDGEMSGYFPVLPQRCELVEAAGDVWMRYSFQNGSKAAVPLSECGVMTKYQFKDDFFGEGNDALNATMNLINVQNQGIENGIKNSATFRFLARMNNFIKPEDLAKERQRFNRENLQDESGGLLLMPNTYSDIKELKSTPFVIDPELMRMIQTNVYSYFGVNEDVLQNKAYGDAWSAFYDGAIEPFAVQISEVMSRMTYTDRERSSGNGIFFTANRLQYATTDEKLKVSEGMVDRGIMNRDEIREIWSLPPLPNGEGQAYVIRGEYKNALDASGGDNSGDGV